MSRWKPVTGVLFADGCIKWPFVVRLAASNTTGLESVTARQQEACTSWTWSGRTEETCNVTRSSWQSTYHLDMFTALYCESLLIINYSTPVGVQSIVISLSVHLSVCLSVCLSVREHISRAAILCADPLWPWLSPPLAALQYVMYFRFCEWRHVWP